MSNAIESVRDAIVQQMSARGLEQKDLVKPGTMVLLAGKDYELKVLAPESQAIDRLEVHLEDGRASYPNLQVREGKKLELGDGLGTWRQFIVDGIDPDLARVGDVAPLELIFTAAFAGQADPKEVARAELAWAVHRIIGEGKVELQPSVGDFALSEQQRQFLTVAMKQPVPEKVDRAFLAQVRDVLAEAARINNAAVTSGTLGLLRGVGLGGRGPVLAEPSGTAAEGGQGFSQATVEAIESRSLTVPHTLEEVGTVFQAVYSDDSVPAEVKRELRRAYERLAGEQEDAVAKQRAELFGEAAAGPTATVVTDTVAQQASSMAEVLRSSTAGLEIPERVIETLANRLAVAYERPQAQLVIIAGTNESAAKRLTGIATQLLSSSGEPIEVDRNAIGWRGASGLSGASLGGIAGGVGMLASDNLERARRDDKKVAVVTRDLAEAGANEPPEQRDSVLVEYLRLLDRVVRDNKSSAYSADANGQLALNGTDLSRAVFVCRYNGTAAELGNLLDEHSLDDAGAKRRIKANVINLPALSPEGAVRELELRVTDLLVEQGLPRVGVALDDEVRADLVAGHASLRDGGYEQIADQLARELVDAVGTGASGFRARWALIPEEKQELLDGGSIGAERWFKLYAADGEVQVPIVACGDVTLLRAKADNFEALAGEVAQLRLQLLKRGKQ
jgi:hypothetical protein